MMCLGPADGADGATPPGLLMLALMRCTLARETAVLFYRLRPLQHRTSVSRIKQEITSVLFGSHGGLEPYADHWEKLLNRCSIALARCSPCKRGKRIPEFWRRGCIRLFGKKKRRKRWAIGLDGRKAMCIMLNGTGGGLELQFKSSKNSSVPWTIYMQTAFDLIPRLGHVEPGIDPVNALTHLIGFKVEGDALAFRLEYVQREQSHCKACLVDSLSTGPHIAAGPDRAVLENGGISVQNPWGEALRLDALWNPKGGFSLRFHAEHNASYSWVTPEITFVLQSAWPLSAFASYSIGTSDHFDSTFRYWQVGVCSDLRRD